MQHIFDIHDFDEFFIEQFTTQTIPIYDLWNIRPLQNEKKTLEHGTSEEIEKFREFITVHSNKDYPHPLAIVVGNKQKDTSSKMLASSTKYYKLKFDKFKGNDLGEPLPPMNGQKQNNMMPLPLNGFHQQYRSGGMQGVSLNEIQGIIDRNVSDVSRSLRAEYDEINAKREAEAIKRIAELETRMEFYKLEMRAKEIEDKERKLREAIDGFEEEQLERMGNVKDYTKTIAGGLMELGKTAFGMEDKEEEKKPKKEKKKEDLKGTDTSEDTGFEEKTEDDTEKLLAMLSNLSPEKRYEVLEIMLDEIDSKQSKTTDSKSKNTNTEEEINEEKTNLKTKNDENIPTEDTDK